MGNSGGDAVGVGTGGVGEDVRGCTWEDVEAALRVGWRVFPLWGLRAGAATGSDGGGWICACPAGAECTQGAGKHPAVAGGFTRALGVADGGQAGVEAVAAWWAEGGGARNLGIRTGSASDLLVVDVDARSGGLESVDQWCVGTGLAVELADLGARRVATGRLADAAGVAAGGPAGHWYLRWDPEWLALGRAVVGKNGVLPGIDIKSDGGYVVGVGSAHVSGGWYRWLPVEGMGGPGAAVPGEFMSWLRDARGGSGGGGNRVGGVGAGSAGGSGGGSGSTFREIRQSGAGVAAGGRDDYFNRLSFQLRSAGGVGVGWEYALAEVRAEWEKCAQPVGDTFAWETALGKLERVWATVPAGGFPQDGGGGGGGVPVVAGGGAVVTAEVVQDASWEGEGEGEGGTYQGVVRDGEDNSDTGNGLRFVRLYRDRARYSRELGAWFVWDEGGGHWLPDRVGICLEKTKDVIADIRTEGSLFQLKGDNNNATKSFKWAQQTSSAGKREAMLKMASVEEDIRIEVGELDADPWLMALRGGMTLDLRIFGQTGADRFSSAGSGAGAGGGVRPSVAGDLITRVAGVSWEDVLEARERLPGRGAGEGVGAGWVGGLWEQHILRMVRGDQEAAAWMRRMAGYSLTGSVQEQIMCLLRGDGENGKNVLMETMSAVWGDYAVKAQAGILTAADAEHPVGLYGLRGARLVFVDEVGRARINETRFKDLVGGAVVRARDIGETWVEFPMQGKVWVAANSLPAVRDSSHGMWRRMRVAPLKGRLGKDGWRRENGYGERLLAECRGEVMAWALSGLVEWMACGVGIYEDMEAESQQYQDEEDMFGLFLRECLVVDPAVGPEGRGLAGVGAGVGGGLDGTPWTDQRALYSSYQMWCAVSQDRRDQVLNVSHFGRELRRVLPGLVVRRGRDGGGGGLGDGIRVQKVYGVRLRGAE